MSLRDHDFRGSKNHGNHWFSPKQQLTWFVRNYCLILVASSFEHMVLLLQCNSVSIRLAVIYRPPPLSTKCSDGQFLSDFSDFLQLLVLMGNKLLIVGDFNIYVDVAGNATARKFLSLFNSYGLTQNVHNPTHLDGHTLDLVISRPSDNVVTNCVVSALI